MAETVTVEGFTCKRLRLAVQARGLCRIQPQTFQSGAQPHQAEIAIDMHAINQRNRQLQQPYQRMRRAQALRDSNALRQQ